MILITGAGGKTGRALVKALANAEGVCALVHREEDSSVAKSLGAKKVIVGDMYSETVIRSAMQNVRAVYHICPNMSPHEVTMGRIVIDTARQNRVEHLVYHSVLHPQTEKMNHHWQKLRVEEMIFESGLSFTILQPAPYMQNLLAGWKSIVEEGVLRVPYSVHSRFSFIDLEDLAEAARLVLTEPNHKNGIYELAGTQPLSHLEVAEIFSHILRRDVRAEKEGSRESRMRLEQNTGLSTYVLENLIKMFDYYDQWGLTGNPNVLRWLLRREPTSVEMFVQRSVDEHNALH